MGSGTRIAHQHHAVAPSNPGEADASAESNTPASELPERGWIRLGFPEANNAGFYYRVVEDDHASITLPRPLRFVADTVTDEQDALCEIRAEVPDETLDWVSVGGEVRISSGPHGALLVDAGGLRCEEGSGHDEEPLVNGRCRHETAVESALQDQLDAMMPTTAQRLASQTVLDEVTVEHAASVATQERARVEHAGRLAVAVSYTNDFDAFQTAYDQARQRQATGLTPVPFLTENATGGLGAREGGRAFGVEIEFDFPTAMSGTAQAEARLAIARDLHTAGIAADARLYGWHASARSGYTDAANAWRLESDATVAGEIVSPILYDEPQTWANLAAVCAIVRSHGAVASARTGGHVHVAVPDFDHTVGNHNRLIETVGAYEDVIYRLAQNPASSRHRGLEWCHPNRIPSSPYTSVGSVRENNNSHHVGLNFQSVTGRGSDHAEFRMWDGSLDPGVIQAQVNLSLGLANTALREAGTSAPLVRAPVGSQRAALAREGLLGRRLSGDRWRESTASFRSLADRIFSRGENRAQAAALFAATRWHAGR
ncbi:amidoligase family protein [Embleya sp. MST-111070]|uniref:amidoligase family protein n=1 Tax=Embleya sp. MST-111070 TaxID=3398231 RepID=UPI003F73539F